MRIVSRAQKLRDRYFPSAAAQLEQRRAEAEAWGVMRGKILNFLTNPYTDDYRKWLRQQERAADPQPGEHASMLYQSGKRDGLRLAQDKFDDLARQAREMTDE